MTTHQINFEGTDSDLNIHARKHFPGVVTEVLNRVYMNTPIGCRLRVEGQFLVKDGSIIMMKLEVAVK